MQPNTISSATTGTPTSPGTASQASTTNSSNPNNTMGKDAFLKLLVTQLQHQDPLNPTDNTQFVAQLAQFSSLEGITNLQTSVNSMASSITSMQNYSTASLIGKNVKASGNSFAYNGQPVTLGFNLGGNASNVSASIYDSSGALVRNQTLGSAPGGDNAISWDGKDASGNSLQKGNYTFTINAKDSNGAAVNAATYLTGPVQGVSFDSGTASLRVNGVNIPNSQVLGIY